MLTGSSTTTTTASTSTSPQLPLPAQDAIAVSANITAVDRLRANLQRSKSKSLTDSNTKGQPGPGPSAVDAAAAPAGQIPSASTSSATNAAAAPAGQTPTASAPSTTNAAAAASAGQKKSTASSAQLSMDLGQERNKGKSKANPDTPPLTPRPSVQQQQNAGLDAAMPAEWSKGWNEILEIADQYNSGTLAYTPASIEMGSLGGPYTQLGGVVLKKMMETEDAEDPYVPTFSDVWMAIAPEERPPLPSPPRPQVKLPTTKPIAPLDAELRLAEAAAGGGPKAMGYILAAMRNSVNTRRDEWEQACEYMTTIVAKEAQEEDSDDEMDDVSADMPKWVQAYTLAPFTPSPKKKRTYADAGLTSSDEDDDDDDDDEARHGDGSGSGHRRGENGDDANASADESLETMKFRNPTKSSSRKPTNPTTVKYSQPKKKKKKVKRGGGGAQLRHDADLDQAQWATVYSYVLSIVATAPIDPELVAISAIDVAVGMKDARRLADGDEWAPEAVAAIGKDQLRTRLEESITRAEQSGNDVTHTAWRHVLDWMIVTTIHRRGIALGVIKPGEFIDDETTTAVRSTITKRKKTEGALRWIRLAHALGDVMFLPLLMLMGDIAFLDKVQRMKYEVFGGLSELLQTGDDGRSKEEIELLWETEPHMAAMRDAARFAARFVIPTACGTMATMLFHYRKNRSLQEKGVWIRDETKDAIDSPSFVGWKDVLPPVADREKDNWPLTLNCAYTGTMRNISFSTPPNIILSASFKRLFKEGEYRVLDRADCSWLEDESTYGALLNRRWHGDPSMTRLYPTYALIMGIDDEEDEPGDGIVRLEERMKTGYNMSAAEAEKIMKDRHRLERRTFILAENLNTNKLKNARKKGLQQIEEEEMNKYVDPTSDTRSTTPEDDEDEDTMRSPSRAAKRRQIT
ncbi:unnamed protein product [Tilletia controversa]|nr:unnamed protein product [Tilletia controversa]